MIWLLARRAASANPTAASAASGATPSAGPPSTGPSGDGPGAPSTGPSGAGPEAPSTGPSGVGLSDGPSGVPPDGGAPAASLTRSSTLLSRRALINSLRVSPPAVRSEAPPLRREAMTLAVSGLAFFSSSAVTELIKESSADCSALLALGEGMLGPFSEVVWLRCSRCVVTPSTASRAPGIAAP